MTSQAFREMMRKATKSCRQANANLLLEVQPGRYAHVELEQKENFSISQRSDQAAQMKWNIQNGIRPTTDEAKLNKTEQSYLAWLERQGNMWIATQAITLKIGHDCRYTPDFAAFDKDGLRLIDVKAKWGNGKVHIEDDAQVKLSVAARLFPLFHFVIAWPDGGNWQHRAFKP